MVKKNNADTFEINPNIPGLEVLKDFVEQFSGHQVVPKFIKDKLGYVSKELKGIEKKIKKINAKPDADDPDQLKLFDPNDPSIDDDF